MKRKKKKSSVPFLSFQLILTAGIALSALTLCASVLWAYPSLFSKAVSLPKELWAQAQQAFAEMETKPEQAFAETEALLSAAPSAESPAGETTPSKGLEELIFSGELGEMTDFDTCLTDEAEETTYYYIMDSAMGPMLYYNQGDSRWADYLYGGADPMRSHGCGPTAAAMVISSFSSVSLTPPEAAAWAEANGYYAPGQGSYHSLIPDSMAAYGLNVQSVKDRSREHVSGLLREGSVLVALMGKGSLTQNGHFIVITRLLENGNVCIADPNSYENSTKEWELSKLLSELKGSRDSGAPLWAVSLPSEG